MSSRYNCISERMQLILGGDVEAKRVGTPGLGYGLLSKDRCKAESVKVTLAVRCILLLFYLFTDKTRSTIRYFN
jgi:hypothetical protein